MDCVAGLRIVDTVVTKISADEDGVVQGDRPPPANPAKDATILGKPAINIKSEIVRAVLAQTPEAEKRLINLKQGLVKTSNESPKK